GIDTAAPADVLPSTFDRTDTANGVEFRHAITVPEEFADLPRVGARFAVPARFTQLRWFGRGPHENYPDRNGGAVLGVWSGSPDEPPYLVPQEFGLRTDCR
ncbi:MAG TPA: beta-galatosidase, partial [Acidimicrobiaceae bacterium]|nr:beta-galatosidase [Acidimicrobiaceae bacterium]